MVPFACICSLILRFDYGSVVPWVTRHADGLHAVAGPDSVYIATGAPTHGKQSTRVSDFVVHANEQVSFTLIWHPSHKPVPSAPDAAKAIERNRAMVATVDLSCRPERSTEKRSFVRYYAQGPDLRSDRRHRGGAHHIPPRMSRRRPQLGLSLLLDLATPPTRFTHC